MIIKMILTNAFDPDPRVYKEAKALIKNKCSVEILCWDRDNQFLNKPIETIDGINIKRFFPKSEYGSGLKQIIGYWQFIKEIKEYLKQEEYDAIHCHDIEGAFAGCFVKKKSKLIWDMHEFYDGFNYGFIKKNLYKIVANKCFKKVSGLIYVSNSQKERYSNKVKDNTIEEVIMNAPDESIFNGFNREISTVLRISFAGSVRDYESLKLLMDIGENIDNVLISINGIGVAYKKLNEIQHNYKNTELTGKFHYNDVKRFYENADIIYAVYNSKGLNIKHAFPVKGFEAIITETPIICSKNTYFGDFVEKNDIGFTIDYGNGEQLEKIVRLAIQNKKLLNEKTNNIKNIKNKFSWSEQSNKLNNFYNELFKNR